MVLAQLSAWPTQAAGFGLEQIPVPRGAPPAHAPRWRAGRPGGPHDLSALGTLASKAARNAGWDAGSERSKHMKGAASGEALRYFFFFPDKSIEQHSFSYARALPKEALFWP